MTITIDGPQRQSLAHAEQEISGWQRSLELAAEQGALDAESLDRFARTFRKLAAAVNEGLAPELDPEATDEIRRRLLAIFTASLEAHRRPLDIADHALMEMEAIRHIVRDLLDGTAASDATTRQLLAEIERWLPTLPVAQLATLLGVDRRTVTRLRDSTAPPQRRLTMVWQLIALLRRSWTDEGVAAWFDRPREALGGRTALDVLDDPAHEAQLLTLARRGRTQIAA